MKKLLLILSAGAVLLAACAGTPGQAGKKEPRDFGAVKGKVWQLAQVQNAAGKITFDSKNLDREFFSDAFTLQFDSERAAGKAAPNRYTAPYTLGAGNAITFKAAASTMMLAFREPEGLREHDYFRLLEKASRWEFANDRLILHTVDENGKKVSMIFNEFDYR